MLKNETVSYINSLKLSIVDNLKTIVFPNITTGICYFPEEIAANIAIGTIQQFEQKDYFFKVIFVCFDDEHYNLYENKI